MSNINELENMSVRPKVRTNIRNETKINYEPLDKKFITYSDQRGEKKSISLISKEFNVKIKCVNYYEPSFEEFGNLSQAKFHSWLLNCKKFETSLRILLNLSYFRFWSVVVYNNDVQESINSYLKNASRPYRLHPILKNGDLKGIMCDIHNDVFKFYSRILMNRESEKNFLSEQFHQKVLQKIFDFPKLNYIFQLYGYGSNSEILKHLLKPYISKNFLSLQNDLHVYIRDVCLSEFRRCFDNFNPNNDLLNELNLTVCHVTDRIFSLGKFNFFEPNFLSVFKDDDIIEKMIVFYNKFFPFVEEKLQELLDNKKIVDNLYIFLKSQLSLAQASSLLTFHHFLKFLKYKIVYCDSPTDRFNIFDYTINILNLVSSEKRFCFDYFTKFDFDQEFMVLYCNDELNEQLSICDVLSYYSMTLKSAIHEYSIKHNGVKDVEKNFNLSYEPKIEKVETVVEKDQFEFETTPEISAKEEMILEMFPHLGDGFVYKCLESYEFNSEKVIDALLECNLPPELDSMNQKLTKKEIFEARKNAIARHIEVSNRIIGDDLNASQKQDKDITDIYIGKKNKVVSNVSNNDDIKQMTMKLAEQIHSEEIKKVEEVESLIERGKLTKDDLKTNVDYMGIDLYDDEFDDTYENEDNLEVSYGLEDEAVNREDDNDDDDDDDDDEGQNELSSNGNENVKQERSSDSRRNNQQQPQKGNYRPTEKFQNSVKYAKKQMHNKRNFNRKQNNNGPQRADNSSDNNNGNNNSSGNRLNNFNENKPNKSDGTTNGNKQAKHQNNIRRDENKSNNQRKEFHNRNFHNRKVANNNQN